MLMKKGKIIIGFIIGIIVASSITAYATYTYVATDVQYKNNKSVAQALNELYEMNNDSGEWVEVENAFITNPSYNVYNQKLYKKGNLCMLMFEADGTSLNTSYDLLVDSKYFPKEEVNVYGWGFNNGMADFTLTTDGKFKINSQSHGNGTGWFAVKNVMYVCNNVDSQT